MAMAYDFDGTLSPGNMQEYDFIPALNLKANVFWQSANQIARDNDADPILSYMHCMLDKARQAKIPVRKKNFLEFGAKIEFFAGVESWFARVNRYAGANGIKMEHFIISSGLREIIQGCKIAAEFKKIYASGFMYDENQVAFWPALAINYTTKTQYLFRINKGSLAVYDDSAINRYTPHEERATPFANMIYLGDGETAVPCMRLLKEQGGHAVAVFQPGSRKAKGIARRLQAEGRVSLLAPADYRENSILEQAVKAIIDMTAARCRLKRSWSKPALRLRTKT
jgi:hypothetical protein